MILVLVYKIPCARKLSEGGDNFRVHCLVLHVGVFAVIYSFSSHVLS